MNKKNYKSSLRGLKLAGVLSSLVLVTGCISAKSPPTEMAEEVAVVPETVVAVAAIPKPVPTPTPTPALTTWFVEAGDNLWTIAGNEEVYNVPERWPLIYKANIDQIEDADLIFPGQIFDIPRNVSLSQISVAVDHARNRGAWAVGPVEVSDREYLRNPG